MASERETLIDKVEAGLTELVGFETPSLYSRDAWGSELSLSKYRQDFEDIFAPAKILTELPVSLLPQQALKSISGSVDNALGLLREIDGFKLSQASGPPAQKLDELGGRARGIADSLANSAGPWISYLAYRKGDVSENIAALNGAVGEARETLTESNKFVAAQKESIGDIVQQAQDIAGDKGVSIFTEQFATAAKNNLDESRWWLGATISLFLVALLGLVLVYFQIPEAQPGKIIPINWERWAYRVAFLALSITGAVWCGSTYRALRHQQAVNSQKRDGLKSFLLFRDAADNDEATRNAVLLETTRAVFSASSSGFVKEHGAVEKRDIALIDLTSRAVTQRSASGSVPGGDA